MAIALKTTHVDKSMRKRSITVEGTLSASYVNGTPITIDLTTVTNPKLLSAGKPMGNPTRGILVHVPAGFTGQLVQGATMKTWGLTLYSASGTELASGAYPAGLTANPIVFEFEGPKGSF